MLWQWAVIIGLSMTPNLVLGQSIAAVLGIRWGLSPYALIPVMAGFGYLEGLGVAHLAERLTRVKFVARWVERTRKRKLVAFAHRWGPWGGMTLGVAMVGQEPVILALRWFGVEMRKLWIPIAVGNLLASVTFYAVVKAGWVSMETWVFRDL